MPGQLICAVPKFTLDLGAFSTNGTAVWTLPLAKAISVLEYREVIVIARLHLVVPGWGGLTGLQISILVNGSAPTDEDGQEFTAGVSLSSSLTFTSGVTVAPALAFTNLLSPWPGFLDILAQIQVVNAIYLGPLVATISVDLNARS